MKLIRNNRPLSDRMPWHPGAWVHYSWEDQTHIRPEWNKAGIAANLAIARMLASPRT